MSQKFYNKNVFVTGAGSGIGRAVALAFGAEGARVILVGRRKEELESTARAIAELGADSVIAAADVTSTKQIEAAVTNASPLDIAVNAAGVVYAGPLDEMSTDTFARTFEVNVRGLWLCLRTQIAGMKANGRGCIVNIGSNVGARITRPGMGAYAASKAAVSSLSRTAAQEAISHGIRINCLCPGPVDTPLSFRAGEDVAARDARIAATNPSKRVASTQEVANAVLWLASDASSYVVGQDIVMDGGASI